MKGDKGELTSKSKSRGKQFPFMIGVKVDAEMYTEIERLVDFERLAGKATLIRNLLTEKLRVYESNPAYKRYKARFAYVKKSQEEEKDES